MAQYSKLIITSKGHALMAKLIAGTATAQFTKICSSSAEHKLEELEKLTELNNIIQTIAISSAERVSDNAVKVMAVFSNEKLSDGYYMRTLGLYAIDPDEGEILYAATVEESGSCYMPVYSGVNVSSAHVNFIVAVGNADHINLEVSPAAVVTTVQCQTNREKLCTAVLAYFDENSLDESFNEIFSGDGGGGSDTSMSRSEIMESINTEWNGESSPSETAMSAQEVQESMDTEWDGSSSPSETAMNKEEIEEATT